MGQECAKEDTGRCSGPPRRRVFFVGGTLAKDAVQGANVDLILATRGDAGIPGKTSWEAAEIREGELRKGRLNLGIRRLDLLGFADGQPAEIPGEKAIGRLVDYAPLAIFGMALFGVLFSLYLTYLEPFIIRAVCAWCLTSDVIHAADATQPEASLARC